MNKQDNLETLMMSNRELSFTPSFRHTTHTGRSRRVRAHAASTHATAQGTHQRAQQTTLATATRTQGQLFRPAAAVGLTTFGALAVTVAAPSIAAAFWAAPAAYKALCTGAALSVSYALARTPGELVGTAVGFALALGAAVAIAPGAAPAALAAASLLGAATGNFAARHIDDIIEFCKTIVFVLVVGIAGIATIGLLLACTKGAASKP